MKVCYFLIFAFFCFFSNSSLISAVQSEDISALRRQLKEGVSIDAVDDSGNTALHWAYFKQNTEIIDLLISEGADTEIENNAGRLPSEIGEPGSSSRISYDQRVGNSLQDSSDTPLSPPAQSSLEEQLKKLIRKGSVQELESFLKNYSTKFIATKKVNGLFISLVVSEGRVTHRLDKLKVFLEWSSQLGFIFENVGDVLKALKIVAKTKDPTWVSSILQASSPSRQSILETAAIEGNESIFRVILDHSNERPFWMMVMILESMVQRGNKKIISIILDSLSYTYEDLSRVSPEILQLILDKYPSINLERLYRITLENTENTAVLQLLIERGVHYETRVNGLSALEKFIPFDPNKTFGNYFQGRNLRYFEFFKFLVQKGARLQTNLRNIFNSLPLSFFKFDVIETFLKAGADPNAGEGRVLHYARQYDETLRIVHLLLEAGADVNIGTKDPIFRSQHEIIPVLLEYGAIPHSWEQMIRIHRKKFLKEVVQAGTFMTSDELGMTFVEAFENRYGPGSKKEIFDLVSKTNPPDHRDSNINPCRRNIAELSKS